MMAPLRKTRFVCISDTHNASPTEGAFKLPKGDVLIHAGDLTRQGTLAELRKTLDWIEEADFEVKIVIAGNHDITLDAEFYAEHGSHFHNQYPQDSQACMDLVKKYQSIAFLNHKSVDIRLAKEDGPNTRFKVFGSPYSPDSPHRLWAFGYPPEKASELWDRSIPLDTDIVVTHTPPKYHCDNSGGQGSIGCEVLRQKLWRIRPSLAVCGHAHEGRGAERVLWDLETPNVRYKELITEYWTDPGLDSKKQSLVDLSGNSRAPLKNTGSWGSGDASLDTVGMRANKSGMGSLPPWTFKDPLLLTAKIFPAEGSTHPPNGGAHPAIWGQGGTLPSGRCDMEALAGRLGKKETCIVNCAIMASSWPYKLKNERKYNKAIIVDIDLPVFQHEKESVLPKPPFVSEQSLISEESTLSSKSISTSVFG